MRIRIEWKRLPAAIAAAVVVGLIQFCAGAGLGASVRTNLTASGALTAAMLAAASVRVRLKSWWSAAIVQACAAFAGMFLLHFALLEGVNLPAAVFAGNYLVSLAVLLMFSALTGCPRAVSAVWLLLCFCYGMANCAVVQFRGNMIAAGDIFALRTALNVADGYKLQIVPRMLTEACVLAICLAAVIGCRTDKQSLRGLWQRGLLVVLAAAAAWTPMAQLKDISPRTWGREGAYYNGMLMQLLAEIDDMHVSPPEGYSEDAVRRLAEEYPAQAAEAGTQNPHVIVIMAEALSDLSVLGDFETNKPVMPVWEGLRGESVHGYALASVLGGGTSNSEWEFLTGNSMALLPAGTNAYRQYVREEQHSLVELFGSRGYRCVAMHPYFGSSWDRSRIYPMMGFDEIYFEDDLEWGERVRKRVSDRAFVDRVIDRYERRAEGERLFLFGITMQNHSDYDYNKPDFTADVRVAGLENDYFDVNQYLSLVHLTDEAVGRLIDYFRGADEPVAILVFGDHQPELSEGFLKEINVKDRQDRYIVPWLLWKNYESEGEELPLTSLNYLPAVLLESIGAELPPYYSFLRSARNALPALNSMGCVIDGESLSPDALSGEAAQALKEYRILQYANVFDVETAGALYLAGG